MGTFYCACFGVSCFVISFIAYVITLGVGWSINQDVYSNSSSASGIDLALRGAAVTSTPGLTVLVVGAVCICRGQGAGGDGESSGCSIICGIMNFACMGIVVFVGAVLFIVAGIDLKDEDPRAMTYAIVAGVFGLIAAVSCCCTVVGCSIATCTDDD